MPQELGIVLLFSEKDVDFTSRIQVKSEWVSAGVIVLGGEFGRGFGGDPLSEKTDLAGETFGKQIRY